MAKTKTITIENAPFCCSLAKGYVEKHSTTPPKIAVIACEGSCLRGEVARQSANIIAYKLSPKKTVRICFQGIVGGGCEEAVLIQRTGKVLFVEGCALKCSSRLVKGALDIKAKMDIIIADQMYDFDRTLFGIDEMPEEEIKSHAEEIAKELVERL